MIQGVIDKLKVVRLAKADRRDQISTLIPLKNASGRAQLFFSSREAGGSARRTKRKLFAKWLWNEVGGTRQSAAASSTRL
jgi:hypothetical protein